MTELAFSSLLSDSNPIDFLEELISEQEWPYERFSIAELGFEISGESGDFSTTCSWVAEMDAILILLNLPIKVTAAQRKTMYELLSRINEKLWAGHFELQDDKNIVFRYTLLLHGANKTVVRSLLSNLLEIVIGACNRFFQAFQFVLWGGKSPREAVEIALIEPMGDA